MECSEGSRGIHSAIKADHAFETTNLNDGAIDLKAEG
jgi:hypothetical protein